MPCCYSNFFWAEKRSAASRKVSACTRKIFTHFLNGVFCTTVKKWRLPIWYKSLASFVDLTQILTRIRTVNFQMGDHEKCIELIDRVLICSSTLKTGFDVDFDLMKIEQLRTLHSEQKITFKKCPYSENKIDFLK